MTTRETAKLYVLGKRDAATVRLAGAGPASVVIVGAGAAGNACAETLRRERYAGPITLVGAEATGPVDRPNLSKDYLAGNAPEEWIPLRGEDFYREHEIELVTGTRVTAIDVARKHVELDGGASRPYGALVLATGAEPVKPPIPGHRARRTSSCCARSPTAARSSRRPRAAKRAVVVGASFIGLEVAASLRARGLEVHVVAPEAMPLARVLGDAIGALRAEAPRGARRHVPPRDSARSAIEADAVVLATASALEADLVVVGRRRAAATSTLAEQAGPQDRPRHRRRRATSRRARRTSGPSATSRAGPTRGSGESIRVEHWVVAERRARSRRRASSAAKVRCDLVPFFWSAHYDVTINYVGHAERWDRIDVTGDLDARDAAVAFRRGGKTLAIATIGRDHAALDAEAAIERGRRGRPAEDRSVGRSTNAAAYRERFPRLGEVDSTDALLALMPR